LIIIIILVDFLPDQQRAAKNGKLSPNTWRSCAIVSWQVPWMVIIEAQMSDAGTASRRLPVIDSAFGSRVNCREEFSG
jgi:hypothetical protein